MAPPKELKRVSEAVWELPTSFKKGMLVPARVYGTEKIVNAMDNGVFDQVTNVACLPGIQNHAYCMPDGHWGYGFPIGGVAAFDLKEGVISPGGIGFDINCGMRMLTTNLSINDFQPKLHEVVDTLFKTVPTGVGVKGFVKVNRSQFDEVSETGAAWCIENNYGWEEDLERMEEHGVIQGADVSKVTDKAKSRGMEQLGTLGSGNHYLEVQVVRDENIFDKELAEKMGIFDGQIVVMIHCGSRGFGHQIATDYLRVFDTAMQKYNIHVHDKELACAPFSSEEGQDYYKAMACAANMAFANRQVILHRVRECFSKIFRKSPEDLEMHLVYDVAHNVAKVEDHSVGSRKKKVLVHRKGSTRSFPPDHPELNQLYKKIGQPVIIGGSMETGSYLLVGTQKAMTETFGSTAHGSGRTMSRTQAKNEIRGDLLQKDMAKHGIYVRATSMAGLAEEAGRAYKNIDDVIDAVNKAGISRPVVGLKPIGNIKG